ncbi:GGDEF domain-containing protein [Wenzhouxiangella sp. EGI_FJ10409]|uniref:GGDEF domain-containing protein n=1 Tax=Wenzhouxiangella sp. EGI_FJ10409 TaxID=3243767 RepID=UPI0035D585F6
MSERMRADLRLAVVTLFAVSSFCIIGPFALYRFSIGQWLTGLADVVIIAIFCGMALLAWIPRWTKLAANIFATAASLGGLFMVLGLGNSAMWLFGALVGNFLMAERRLAIAVSVVVIASVALRPTTFSSGTEYFTFIAVATMVSLFSLIFSTRVDNQHRELSRIAARDGLTGALNRRSLDRDLSALAEDFDPADDPHCVVIMDIDNFKELNDVHGHETGDRVLARLTELVQSNTRSSDRFYRYGGEEFVLMLPNTTLDGARTALDKLKGMLAAQLSGPERSVTVSFGIAELHPHEPASDWLSRADKALLLAKRSGKDCYKVA